MLNKKVKKIGILLLIFCFFPFACLEAAQLNKIAAVVNGKVITMFDLQKEALPSFARARLNPADTSKKADVDKVLRSVLDDMIMNILVTQEAQRLKATVSNSEIDAELAGMMKARKLSKQQLEAQLAREKMTVEDLRKTIEKSILRRKVMTMEVGRRVIVTPQEINDYYEQHKDEMIDRSGLHMGLLVYSPKVNADSIAAQIKSGKITFEEASAKYSIAPNKEKGGDAGPIQWEQLNPEWEGRLTRMKPGDVTEIFPLQGFKAQVHLFRPGGGAEKKLTLQEATPQIDAILRQPKAKERFADYARQLKDKAVIDIRL